MIFSCFTQKLKEKVGGLLEGPKGMLAPPPKLLGGPGPPWPPLFLRLCYPFRFNCYIENIDTELTQQVNTVFYVQSSIIRSYIGHGPICIAAFRGSSPDISMEQF